MSEPKATQPSSVADDIDRPTFPDETALAEDAADTRVVCAAAELGVKVPQDFYLMGIGPDGTHTAFIPGTANDLRVGAAILARLDGASVSDCQARMRDSPEPVLDPRPEWMPPEDWNDAEAWRSWTTERSRHPEWPNFYNSPADWLPLVTTGTGLATLVMATASVIKQRDRIKFAKWLVELADRRGLDVDPVAVIRAFERGAPERSTGTSVQGGSEPQGGEQPPVTSSGDASQP
ncbi:hypothetical protein ACQP00_06225 [Dactylosporangium sp. CS-047395]|uniref:hypothetical protein n=1 Tax=Dactylosporangium sp. CS-047395 TaxID=3239936 RepID=UPI003D8F1ACA